MLAEIIKQRIAKEGPISFCEYMEMCLYHPQGGYYSAEDERIGKEGDFYTSPVLTPVFGQMIGKQLEEMLLAIGPSAESRYTIVEYGAGTGALCHAILDYFKEKPLYDKLDYCIIEKSEAMRVREQEKLNSNKVSWHSSISSIGPVCGCVLSNELVDNIPVHVVVMEDELMEVFVDYKDGFCEVLRPANEALKTYLKELNVALPKGYRTEINLHALEWMKEVAEALQKGFVLTIDYGFRSRELYSARRSEGTIVCYHKHTVNYKPYENIGEQDITAHVNFSALALHGTKYGLKTSGFTDQSHFLRGLGVANHLRELEKSGGATSDILQMNTLLMNMSNKFKVLIQEKEMGKVPLSGLMFPQPLE